MRFVETTTTRNHARGLRAAARRLEQGRYVDLEMLAGILRFFRRFVCDCHHLKEETGIFPLITASGREAALVSTFITEHATHRAMVEELSDRAMLEGLADLRKRLQGKDTATRDTFIFKCGSTS